jgi:hypothetical protein
MKFIDKLMAILVLRVIAGPTLPGEVGGLVLSLWAMNVAAIILFYAVTWEFAEQLADLTALNELMETKIEEKTMKLLEFFERDA